MKILSTISFYTPYVSGLTLCTKRVADALQQRGHTITILAMKHQNKLYSKETIDSVGIVRVNPTFSLSKGFISLSYPFVVWKQILHHDVILINTPQFEGLLTAFIATILHKPIIVVYHCEVVLPPGTGNRYIQWGLDLSHRIQLHLSSTVITYTKDYADHSRLLKNNRSVRPIYPPVPLLPEKKTKTIELKKLSQDGTVLLGVASRLAREKGIEYLLDALPLLGTMHPKKKFKVVIAGPLKPVGEESYRDMIMKKVKAYTDQVIFLETLNQDEMGSFYSVIDILILPSINATEAFGLVQVEAMEYGVPVIASDLPGVRVPIQETGMGVIVPLKNSVAIATAVTSIIHNKKKYKRSKAIIEQKFSFKAAIDAYEQTIKNVVKTYI